MPSLHKFQQVKGQGGYRRSAVEEGHDLELQASEPSDLVRNQNQIPETHNVLRGPEREGSGGSPWRVSVNGQPRLETSAYGSLAEKSVLRIPCGGFRRKTEAPEELLEGSGGNESDMARMCLWLAVSYLPKQKKVFI